MFNKILVPLDGSPLAESVLPHVLALSQAFKAEVTFVHVLDYEVAIRDAQVDPLAWHLRKAEGQSYLQRMAERWAEVAEPAEIVLLEGAAAERIVAHAREQAHDLIILGSHGRSGLSEWNVSSVVQKVIMRVFRSILLVRATSIHPDERLEPARYRRILVPLDGSKRAESVLPLAQRLIEASEIEATAVHIIQRPVTFRQPSMPEDIVLVDQFVERNRAEVTAYLEEIRERLGLCAAQRVEVSESPAMALIDMAEAENNDLVLLAAHGRTAAHQPYGSLVTGFIHYTTVPLLIYQDLPENQLWRPSAMTSADIMPSGRAPLAVGEQFEERP